jgi:hypothetical protein
LGLQQLLAEGGLEVFLFFDMAFFSLVVNENVQQNKSRRYQKN